MCFLCKLCSICKKNFITASLLIFILQENRICFSCKLCLTQEGPKGLFRPLKTYKLHNWLEHSYNWQRAIFYWFGIDWIIISRQRTGLKWTVLDQLTACLWVCLWETGWNEYYKTPRQVASEVIPFQNCSKINYLSYNNHQQPREAVDKNNVKNLNSHCTVNPYFLIMKMGSKKTLWVFSPTCH